MSARPLGTRELFVASLPAVAASLLEPVAGMVDTAFLGHIDSSYVAALALTATLLSAFAWVFNFLVNGVTAQVAEALGKRDSEQLGARIRLSLVVALAAGGLTAIGLLALREPLFRLVLGAPEALTELASPYFVVRALGVPLVLLMTALTGILRGMQRLALSLVLNLVVTLANVALTAFLLFVLDMGLVGAAIGTVASFGLGCVLGAGILVRERHALGLSGSLRVSRAHLLDFGTDSLNLVLRTASLVGSFFVATAVTTRLGETILAAHQVALQLWLFSSFLIDGFAISANSFGARHLGEGRADLRQALGHRLLALGGLTGVAFALSYAWAREPLQGLFTPDRELHALLDTIWPIVAWTQPMNGLVYVYDGLLFGARDFAYLRRHMLIGAALCFAPLVLLAVGRGSKGLPLVWLALAALNAYRAISCAWRFHRPQSTLAGAS